MPIASIRLAELPAIGAPLDGGTFAGVTTHPDGTHCAVVLLPEQGRDLTHAQAIDWARQQGGVLPTKPIAALLVANIKSLLRSKWHWLAETHDASYAWYCGFLNGYQYDTRKSVERSAVAVRSIPLIP